MGLNSLHALWREHEHLPYDDRVELLKKHLRAKEEPEVRSIYRKIPREKLPVPKNDSHAALIDCVVEYIQNHNSRGKLF